MTSKVRDRPQRLYNFKAPLDLETAESADPLLPRLVATPAFQRLRDIRFLGGIDYARIPSPNGRPGSRRYTRFQHSLGVARLALLYADERQLPSADRRLIAAAALLHDVGHAPLSHSLEPVFKEAFGIDHHAATEDVLRARVPLGSEVGAVLAEAKVDVDRLAAVIAGREPGHDGFFAGPINFDTIEGILRSQTYEYPVPKLRPDAVMLAASRRSSHSDREKVDEFWDCKDRVYRDIINSKMGMLADALCQDAMRRHLDRFSRADYLMTERAAVRSPARSQEPAHRARFRATGPKNADSADPGRGRGASSPTSRSISSPGRTRRATVRSVPSASCRSAMCRANGSRS